MRIRSWDNVATFVLAALMFGGGLAIVIGQTIAIVGYTPECVPDAQYTCTWGVGGHEATVEAQRQDFMPGALMFLAFGVVLIVMGIVAAVQTRRKQRRGF